MDEDVMAAARPSELEAEGLDEPTHVRERNVRNVAPSESWQEPLWIHSDTLSSSADKLR